MGGLARQARHDHSGTRPIPLTDRARSRRPRPRLVGAVLTRRRVEGMCPYLPRTPGEGRCPYPTSGTTVRVVAATDDLRSLLPRLERPRAETEVDDATAVQVVALAFEP